MGSFELNIKLFCTTCKCLKTESTSHVMNVGGCESLLKSQRCGYGIQVLYFKVNIE